MPDPSNDPAQTPAETTSPGTTDTPASDAAPATDAPKADAPATDTPAADKPADPAADKPADPPIGVVTGGEGNPDNVAEPATADGEHDPPHGMPVNAVVVNQYNRRSDSDLIEGQYVDIVSGEHAGRSGAYLKTVAFNEDTGYPSRILVRTDDDEYEFLVENVTDCKHKASAR